MINWNTRKIKIGELELFESNPRTISTKKYIKLKESLDELGIFRPFIVDYDCKTVLGGNQRSRALLEKFAADYEVIIMVPDKELSQKEKEKIVLQDNSHYGSWDMDVISNDFELGVDEIEDMDLDLVIPDILDGISFEEEEPPLSDVSKKKHILEVQLANDMELRDLHDDLVGKGYMVKEL